MAGWTAYKTALIVADGTDGSMRVSRPENGNDTVSEGISYGMLFAVYLNDKTTFDALWKYEQKHLDSSGMMNCVSPGRSNFSWRRISISCSLGLLRRRSIRLRLYSISRARFAFCSWS